MKNFLISFLLIITCSFVVAQQSDFIVLKNKNNRTLKSYFPGTFISASTYAGFNINGFIKSIRNDTLLIEQQDIRQRPTQFGVPVLDTVVFEVPVYYRDLFKFEYKSHKGPSGESRRTGFSEVTIPRIMTIGGAGYLILELVNSAYRKESLSDGNKLTGLAIASGVAAGGVIWSTILRRNDRAGGKYKVVYIKMQ